MEEKKFTTIIYDNSTGEIISRVDFDDFRNKNKTNIITKDIIKEKTRNDKELIFNSLRNLKQLNKFNLIRLKGVWLDMELLKNSLEHNLAKELNTLIIKVSARNFIKKTKTSNCTNLTELYETIGISNKTKRTKFKNFLTDNDIIRFDKDKTLVVNPLKVRKCDYVSSIALSTFKDVCLPHLHIYSAYYLYLKNLIEYDDLTH